MAARIAIVTGGGSGIGEACSRALVAAWAVEPRGGAHLTPIARRR